MAFKRFQPLSVSRNLTLKNRLVLPPMASQTANTDGKVTEQTLAHYARLSRSGAGLLMVEYSFVTEDGRSEPHQLGAHDDNCLHGLTQLASLLKETGAVAGLQLTHCGGKTTPDVTLDMMGPSSITVPAYDRELTAPRAMEKADIDHWQRAFIEAAIRAETAGFDLVELHCAHGYGLNQWLSPLTNQRHDEYGGSLRNRARMLLEIVASIRLFSPDLTLMVRVPGQDGYPDGLSREDMAQVCEWLVEAGVALINVSSGIGGWKRPKDKRGEGYLVDDAAYLKQQLTVPVIGVGGIETPEYIEQALANQWLDLAAVGRFLLADPDHFRTTLLSEPTVQTA
ncbi:NADH:flavin oxidoreductase [Photobacterium sp. CCB-ST2H9]|uniref:NADH:flavin oxidoreductase n=1 Tax=Photobacterium sp. CCB-ST2H9 TaxID=2912855 RepID=UPI0020043AF7|nr:NADH:flavin oxidoreductase [Photobacterium sp. CCB-ST2H9]UTM58499.1 NADH:flavin oxidoreductase [Photobacterium sp. CCB-ST2H9]